MTDEYGNTFVIVHLHEACETGQLVIIEFYMKQNNDPGDKNCINTQNNDHFSPLHCAIKANHFDACQLILGYKQVSRQNIEAGITLTKIYDTPEIRALLEKSLKKRRKVILVCSTFCY
jgi:ankyrin repeat protein